MQTHVWHCHQYNLHGADGMKSVKHIVYTAGEMNIFTSVHRQDGVTCEYIWIWILLYVDSCTITAISRQKETRSRDYALLSFRMTSRLLYSGQYHRQHCVLHAFEQFGELYMHNHDDKYPSKPGFEPGTPRLQAPVDTIEPSGPAGSHVKDRAARGPTSIHWSQP